MWSRLQHECKAFLFGTQWNILIGGNKENYVNAERWHNTHFFRSFFSEAPVSLGQQCCPNVVSVVCSVVSFSIFLLLFVLMSVGLCCDIPMAGWQFVQKHGSILPCMNESSCWWCSAVGDMLDNAPYTCSNHLILVWWTWWVNCT